jgi:hypothetical protein
MRAARRRLGVAITLGIAVLGSLPAAVSADCNGPTCGDATPAVDGPAAFVFFAILVAFGTVMAIAEARRR